MTNFRAEREAHTGRIFVLVFYLSQQGGINSMCYKKHLKWYKVKHKIRILLPAILSKYF